MHPLFRTLFICALCFFTVDTLKSSTITAIRDFILSGEKFSMAKATKICFSVILNNLKCYDS